MVESLFLSLFYNGVDYVSCFGIIRIKHIRPQRIPPSEEKRSRNKKEGASESLGVRILWGMGRATAKTSTGTFSIYKSDYS